MSAIAVVVALDLGGGGDEEQMAFSVLVEGDASGRVKCWWGALQWCLVTLYSASRRRGKATAKVLSKPKLEFLFNFFISFSINPPCRLRETFFF